MSFKKPIQTIGEVPDRSLLSYEAEKMGADGIIYNGVYDNGYNNNQVVFSFNRPELGDDTILLSMQDLVPQMTDALVYNSIDSTAGAGLLPSVSIINPFDGKFKTLTVPFRPNGKFRATPGLKVGGTIPSYLKVFKGR